MRMTWMCRSRWLSEMRVGCMYRVTGRSESHPLLLFDVLWSDRVGQRDDGLLLRVSGQRFPHICNSKGNLSAVEALQRPLLLALANAGDKTMMQLRIRNFNYEQHTWFMSQQQVKTTKWQLWLTHRTHLHQVLRCWLNNTQWRSCRRCSPGACTCSPPPDWTLGQRDPQRIHLSYRMRQCCEMSEFITGHVCLPSPIEYMLFKPLRDFFQHFHEFGSESKSPELGGHWQRSDVTVPLFTSHGSLRLPHDCTKPPQKYEYFII